MAQHIETIRWYVIIFAWLMGLLLLTIIAAMFDLGAIGLAIALTIALVKAMLVVLYFMHVRYAGKLVWVFAGAAFMWLAIMLSLTLSDYATRPANPSATNSTPMASAQR